jgi:hydroxyacylglutathione hydrolase
MGIDAMPLLLERIDTEGLAQLSYLVGDSKAGVAAVIDPRRDVDVYLRLARDRDVRITHLLETHVHADFVSGAHELKARTGAEIVGGSTADYHFPLRQMSEGEEIALGSVTLRALHTPGHTPEHLSVLVRDAQQGREPFGVFTGDTLFNLDVGRPDLIGGGTERDLAAQLYRSLFDKLVPLGDRIEIYPCHGAGSACGKSIGDRKQSTIGNERVFNPALKDRGEAAFIDWVLGGMPEPPRHYAHLKRVNAAGAPVRGGVPVVPPIAPDAFQRMAKEDGTVVIDARSILAFGGGHVPGAINIGLRPEFPNWVGWMIAPGARILLVVESARDLPLAAAQLFRLGFDTVEGYLHDGMTRWQNAGLPLARITEWTVHELDRHRRDPDLIVLDVRSDEEFAKGFVPGARHIYVPHLREHLDDLDRSKTIATYCGSGYRASIASSILQKHGFQNLVNIPGSWAAWQAARLPVERPRDGA